MRGGWDASRVAVSTSTEDLPDEQLSFRRRGAVFSGMDALSTRAIAAAVATAERFSLKAIEPVLLRDGSNALVHLAPHPLVARVATTTGWVRRPAQTWLQRDLEVATFLHQAGFPVVPPATEIPPGPHTWMDESAVDEAPLALTFWKYVVHDRARATPLEAAVEGLHAMHRALRDFPGQMPYMGTVLDEIPHWLKWLEVRRRLGAFELIALREVHWELASRLMPTHLAARMPVQVLHGDAHRRNLLQTPDGPLWTDFEDTCVGPVAWDIATFLSHEAEQTGPEGEDAVLRLYPEAPGWDVLLPYMQARELEAVVFMQIAATRFADRQSAAAGRLQSWMDRRMRSG